MKTRDLIRSLAADTLQRAPLRRVLLLALASGVVAAFAVWWMMLGPAARFPDRDAHDALDFKFVVTFCAGGHGHARRVPHGAALSRTLALRRCCSWRPRCSSLRYRRTGDDPLCRMDEALDGS